MAGTRTLATFVLATAAAFAPIASAQESSPPAPADPTAPAGPVDAPKPGEVERQREREARQRRSDMERELRKIRAKFIHNVRNTELRQIGILKIREFTDPSIFPAFLEIFRKEGADVRAAILDHLVEIGTEDADATLAWAAIYEKDLPDGSGFRTLARERLRTRATAMGEVPRKIRSVVAQGLRDRDEDVMTSAAQVAQVLKLVEAIPMLINAQVGGGGGGGDDGRGALAYILVGQQQAFISDLTPVVGDSAVAFDPELSVLTTGTVIRVFDAAVVTYRIDIHNSLIGLSSEAWGRSTASLGWDQAAWREWYVREFLPSQKDKG